MFTVNEYKIVFKRRWHQRRLRKDGDPAQFHILYHQGYYRQSSIADPTLVEEESDGRYDTVCEIYIEDLEGPRFTGVAKLHPNDQVDRIVGKKIALRNAMNRGFRADPISKKYVTDFHLEFYIKSKRTAIWKAFWQWVSQWPNQPAGKAHPVMQKPR